MADDIVDPRYESGELGEEVINERGLAIIELDALSVLIAMVQLA